MFVCVLHVCLGRRLGICVRVAHDMILFASENLPNNFKELAIEAQMILIDMYANGTGVIKNNLEAYKWAYIVNLSNNSLASSILIKLRDAL